MDNISDSGLNRFIKIIFQNRKRLFLFNSIIFVIAIIISLLLPKWYKSDVTIIVNDQVQNSMLASLNSNIPFNLFGQNNSKLYQYINFIHSKRFLDRLDSLFDLSSVYDNTYRKDFYKELRSNIIVIDNEDNTITVEFYYKSEPEIAAQIANQIFLELDKLSLNLNSERNMKIRQYLEKSYKNIIQRLEIDQTKLTDFQVANKLYDVKQQLIVQIETIAELEALKIQKEIELSLLKRNSSKSSSMMTLKYEIAFIQKKIEQMINGPLQNGVPLNSLPELSKTFFNLMRSVKIQEKVLEYIIPQLENARLEEVKSASDIQLLDHARPEYKKSKPKRIAVVFVISFIAAILSSFYFILKDALFQNRKFIEYLKE